MPFILHVTTNARSSTCIISDMGVERKMYKLRKRAHLLWNTYNFYTLTPFFLILITFQGRQWLLRHRHNTHINALLFIPLLKFDREMWEHRVPHTHTHDVRKLAVVVTCLVLHLCSTRFFQTLRFRFEPALVQWMQLIVQHLRFCAICRCFCLN